MFVHSPAWLRALELVRHVRVIRHQQPRWRSCRTCAFVGNSCPLLGRVAVNSNLAQRVSVYRRLPAVTTTSEGRVPMDEYPIIIEERQAVPGDESVDPAITGVPTAESGAYEAEAMGSYPEYWIG